MNNTNDIKNSLLLSVISRIEVSNRFPEYFYDEKALELQTLIDNSNIFHDTNEFFLLSNVSRFYKNDIVIKEFIDNYKSCNIIMIGSGLETSYYRNKDDKALFYNIDLPQVIDIRREIIPDNEKNISISTDIFSLDWLEKIDKNIPSLICVTGVFLYFEEDLVIKFIDSISDYFDDSKIVFDVINKKGLDFSNSYSRKRKTSESLMKFYIEDANKFANKTKNAKLIRVMPFYDDALKILKKNLKFTTKMLMKATDKKRRASIVYLDLRKD